MYKKLLFLFIALFNFSFAEAPAQNEDNATVAQNEENVVVVVSEQEMIELANTPLHNLDTNFLEKLIRLFKVDVFVETSTYLGETSSECSRLFREVYTIEENHKLYLKAKKKFKHIPNVYCLEGAPEVMLKKHIPKIHGRILFWLDSHHKYGHDQKSIATYALRKELDVIKTSGIKNSIILINEIQMFQKGQDGDNSIQQLKDDVLAINPDYQFWILGNIAIVFPSDDKINVSPLVKACTTSWLFSSNGSLDQVLKEEKIIMESLAQKDHAILEGLQEVYETQRNAKLAKISPDPAVHYVLWKGLALLGKKEYFEASRCFHNAIAKGYDHWRVYWYIANAEYERRNLEEASRALQRVLKAAPDFAEAQELAEKIKVKN